MFITRFHDMMINESNINFQKIESGYGDVLINKLLNEEPFIVDDKEIIIKNGQEIVDSISTNGKWDSKKAKSFLMNGIRYTSVFLGDDDYYYRLSQFKKTEDFGSNRGTNLGSIDTSYVEAIQCIAFSYRQEVSRNITKRDLGSLLKCLKNIKLNVETKFDLSEDDIKYYWDNWSDSLVKMTNSMYNFEHFLRNSDNNEKSTLLDKRQNYIFSQTGFGQTLTLLVNKFNELKVELPLIPNISKWCPADIWAIKISSQKRIEIKIKNAKNFKHLTDIISELFDRKDLVGMSLKKVNKNEEIKILVNKENMVPRYKFQSIKVSDDPFKTTGVQVIVKRSSTRGFEGGLESLTFRKFSSGESNISGEVNGKTAQHGKISLNVINFILMKYKNLNVYTKKAIETIPLYRNDSVYSSSISSMSDSELKKEIKNISILISNKYQNITTSYTSKEVNRPRLISKYQSLFLSWVLMELENIDYSPNVSVADKIIQDIFYYALSIFIPGKTSYRTPKYVRVVD